MPTYEIEQYELHAMKYRVQADNEDEAVLKLFDGEAEPVGQSQDLIEVASDYGMPTDDFPALAKVLKGRGMNVDKDIIPSIRSIELVWPPQFRHALQEGLDNYAPEDNSPTVPRYHDLPGARPCSWGPRLRQNHKRSQDSDHPRGGTVQVSRKPESVERAINVGLVAVFPRSDAPAARLPFAVTGWAVASCRAGKGGGDALAAATLASVCGSGAKMSPLTSLARCHLPSSPRFTG